MSCCLLFLAFHVSYFTCHVSYYYHIFVVVSFSYYYYFYFICHILFFVFYLSLFTTFIGLKAHFWPKSWPKLVQDEAQASARRGPNQQPSRGKPAARRGLGPLAWHSLPFPQVGRTTGLACFCSTPARMRLLPRVSLLPELAPGSFFLPAEQLPRVAC